MWNEEPFKVYQVDNIPLYLMQKIFKLHRDGLPQTIPSLIRQKWIFRNRGKNYATAVKIKVIGSLRDERDENEIKRLAELHFKQRKEDDEKLEDLANLIETTKQVDFLDRGEI